MKRHSSLEDTIIGIFKFYWILWIVSAIVSLGFLGVIGYILIKLAMKM